MNPTLQPQDDELLSAYLDGELGDDDRAHVDHLLKTEPEYRKVYEELKSLRDSLQALPMYTLGERFHEHVLRAIEQSRPSSSSTRPGTDSASTSSSNWRKFVLVAVTLAGAVLIMALQPWQPADKRPIARVPAPTDFADGSRIADSPVPDFHAPDSPSPVENSLVDESPVDSPDTTVRGPCRRRRSSG